MHKCIIYGSGKWGQRAFLQYSNELDIVCFLDANISKHDTNILGKKVYSPVLYKGERDILVLVAVANSYGIEEYLHNIGYKDILFYNPNTEIDLLGYLEGGKNYYNINVIFERPKIELVIEKLKKYDVISFDIFDTAIFRLVEKPTDIFRVLGNIKQDGNFHILRHKIEMELRNEKEAIFGNREIAINEIYEKLHSDARYPVTWLETEQQLEIDLTQANEYILSIYKRLKELGKEIIFSSDMYLSRNVLTEMLLKAGYKKEKIYLSNEDYKSKEMGDLFKKIKADYPQKKIIHIGDNKVSDIQRAEEVGIDTYYYPQIKNNFIGENSTTLDASFYHAIVNNTLNNGLSNNNIYYEHGFRIGGILAVGFCNYINQIVKEKNIDKILFCGRDCKVISDIYNAYFNNCENTYIRISRRAILEVGGRRYLEDYIGRNLTKYFTDYTDKTIGDILKETNFDFLSSVFDEDDIELEAYPREVTDLNIRVLKCITVNYELLKNRISPILESAKEYYKKIIDGKKQILIVDIGWSGSCITILRDFIRDNINSDVEVFGALMCGSRSENFIAAVNNGILDSYIYSPYHNHDLEDFMMPKNKSVSEQDYFHMPLEYLFTSTEKSLLSYERDDNGNFKVVNKTHKNLEEIDYMHKGMKEFAEIYFKYVDKYCSRISPYVAFEPFKEAVIHEKYCNEVYQGFQYDVETTPLGEEIVEYGESKILKKHQYENTRTEKKNSTSNNHGAVIISLTSYPKRIATIHQCIESLLNQSYKEYSIVLWLSVEQFPNKEKNLPEQLIQLLRQSEKFKIRWVADDIKPHKKYYYAMQEYRDYPIITVDDDVIYDKDLVDTLMHTYSNHPHAVSCMRCHYITHKNNGEIRGYKGWLHKYNRVVNEEDFHILPVGVGGVLYPPNIMPQRTFDKEMITSTCLNADDLWLKINELINDIPAVLASKESKFSTINGTQEYGLYRENLNNNMNDFYFNKIISALIKEDKEKIFYSLR